MHAATMIAVSANGAKEIRDALLRGEMQAHHWDVMLIRWLTTGAGREFTASYLYPCIGHYQAHMSQSSDHEGWRESAWDNAWVQEGTRAADALGGRTRWLCTFQEKATGWLRAVRMPEHNEDLRWFTRTTAPAGWHARARDRASASAMSLSPGTDDVEMEEGKGTGKGKSKRMPVLIQPLWRPDATEMDDGPEVNTARRKRQRRAHTRDYAFRIFAEDGQQVGPRIKKP